MVWSNGKYVDVDFVVELFCKKIKVDGKFKIEMSKECVIMELFEFVWFFVK